MENLVFISAQPYDFYFVWQVEVQIVNFRKHGISDKMHVLVWYPDAEILKAKGKPAVNVDFKPWTDIAAKYPEVHFHFYIDRGVDLELYIPQLRPHILARHFDANPDLKTKTIFYHDSDIIFNYLPDFEYLARERINWQSDTSGYLDFDYLTKKEQQGKIPDQEAVKKLCQIGNIPVQILEYYKGRTGGAQYILKGIDGDFWRDVERQVLEIRRAFLFNQPNSINARYFTSENEGFQSWCADMWAVNMALWSRGIHTDVTPLLDFSWATDNTDTYLKKPIFHNAGANGTQPGVFYKAKWMNKSPIGLNHSIKKDSASSYYVEAIKEVK